MPASPAVTGVREAREGQNLAGDSGGFYSDKVNVPEPIREEPEPGDSKEYELGVRWRRVGDLFPVWLCAAALL
jgi:hypothetical protein